MSKNIVNQRFIEVINFLISEKKVPSKSFLAEKFGIKASKFSEILNERMNVGVDLLSILTDDYNINAEWLLTGNGSMLKSGEDEPFIIDKEKRKEPFSLNQMIFEEQDKLLEYKYLNREMLSLFKEKGELLERNISILESRLKDKEDKEILLKDKIADLEENKALLQAENERLKADIQVLKSAQSTRVNQSNQPNQPRPSV